MRSIEEVKKDQDQCIYDLGFHTIRAEQLKLKIFNLAKEAEQIHRAQDSNNEEKEQ